MMDGLGAGAGAEGENACGWSLNGKVIGESCYLGYK